MDETWRPAPGEHLRGTTLSDVFRSKATSRWTVAISTPVFDKSPEKKFLGVVAMTVEVGRFVEFPGGENQFAVLVDNREGKHKGVVLQHPLFDKLMLASQDEKLPDRFKNYRVNADDLPDTPRARGALPRSAGGRPGRAASTTSSGWPAWSRSASATRTPAGS